MGRVARSVALLLALPALARAAKTEWRSSHTPWASDDGDDYESRRAHKSMKGASAWGGAAGLEDGLKSGGAEGLIEALKAMQMVKASRGKSDESAMHIKKDANGNLMYDFRSPSTTPAPTPAPTLAPPKPVVAAAKPASVAGAAASKVAALHMKGQVQTMPGDPMAATPMQQMPQQQQMPQMPQQGAFGGMPMPQAAFGAMPMPQAFFGAVPPMPQQAAAFAGAGAGAQTAGGYQMQALAAGLQAVKERVDVLVEDAQMAMGGRAIPAMGMPQPSAAQPASAAVPAELQKSVKDLLPRVAALEKQSKLIQGQVKQAASHHLRKKAAGNATEAAARNDEKAGEENGKLQEEVKQQAGQIKAMREAEQSEKDRLGKVEAKNDELQKEVKALLALEKKRISNTKKQKMRLKHKHGR